MSSEFKLVRSHFFYFCFYLSFWVLSQFKKEICHNLTFGVMSQYELWSYVTIWLVEFCCNLIFILFRSQIYVLICYAILEFLFWGNLNFIFLFCCNLGFWFVAIWVLQQLSVWLLSLFEFFSFVHLWVLTRLSVITIWVFFFSQFKLLSFVGILVFDFCHHFSFSVLSQFDF